MDVREILASSPNKYLPPQAVGTVQWYGKTYAQLTADDKVKLKAHCYELGEKLEDYRKFLVHHCDYPSDFLGAA